ncbi:hypothetical protein V8C44DRAFT_352287 [Trichoderma aethiopicum]
MCSCTRTQCTRTKSRAQSPTTRSFADEDHSCPILRKCLVSGCSRQFSGENVLEKWLAHLYTHMEQDRSQTFKALEGNSKLIEWSSKPDTGIIQKVAGKWTLRKCLCKTLEDYKMLLPSPSTESRPSSMSMDSSDYAYSRFSQAWDDVLSRKSSPTAETVPGQAPSNHESSRRSLDGEHVSPSDLLDEFRHFTLSWFSAWLATQPGHTELNPGNQSTQEYSGRGQGQSSQQQKRKARRQNDKDRGERKVRRRDRSDEGDPDDNDNGGPSAAQSAPPDLEDEKFLACPFNKRNPSYFRHGRFGLCESGGWKSYHRVREHLIRKHTRPAHVCERCFADFKDDASLQRHTASCADSRENPFLSPAQLEQLKAANMRGKPEAEKWREMFRIIFPGRDVPDPYKNAPSYNEPEMRLREAIDYMVLHPHNAPQNLLQTFENIMYVAIHAIYGTSGAARDGADRYVAAARAWIESWGFNEGVAYMTDFPSGQTGADLLGVFSDMTNFGDNQNESRAFDEFRGPPGATNYHVDYQHDPWLPAYPLRMPSDTAGLLDDQEALGAFDEGERGPDATVGGYQDAFGGFGRVPDAPDNVEHLDDAWMFDENAGSD